MTKCATVTEEKKVLVVNVFDTDSQGKYHAIEARSFFRIVWPRMILQPFVSRTLGYCGYH